MKAHLVAAFGITLSVALGAAGGCGAQVDPQGAGEETALESEALTSDALSTSTLSLSEVIHDYTVRRDLRTCREPLCGGWYVTALNSGGAEVHVSSLDFSRAGLTAGGERVLLDPPEQDIVLRGALARPDRDGEPVLAVFEAFRGMPDFAPASGDGYYTVRCLVPTCEVATAHRVDTTSDVEIHGVSVAAVLAPFVSEAWLVDRVESHGAVVAGHLALEVEASGADGRVLEASQVFVGLPVARGPCASIEHFCEGDLTPTYTRDVDLCLDFVACVPRGFCPLFQPACAEGYSLTYWPAGEHACPAFACDPSFLDE